MTRAKEILAARAVAAAPKCRAGSVATDSRGAGDGESVGEHPPNFSACGRPDAARRGGPMDLITPGDWDWVIGVNLMGAIHCIQAFLPHLSITAVIFV